MRRLVYDAQHFPSIQKQHARMKKSSASASDTYLKGISASSGKRFKTAIRMVPLIIANSGTVRSTHFTSLRDFS
jgi:hypothetical protein